MNKIQSDIFSKIKKPKMLIILGIAGMLFIFMSSLFSGEEKDTARVVLGEMDIEEYKENLEDDIRDMVFYITGSKKISVIVTLDSGMEYSYADQIEEASGEKTEGSEKSIETEYKTEYITVKTEQGGEKAILLRTEMPEIRGVAVVCEGGDDEVLREKIENTVTAALNITSKRVYICGRN